MKKILGLTVAALLVMALVGGGTWAYFSDVETSSGNVFTAGTLDLGLSNTIATTPDGSVIETWDVTVGDWAPGDTVNATLYVYNDGTIDMAHVTVALSYTAVVDGTPAGVTAPGGDNDLLDKMIEATTVEWGPTGSLVSVANWAGQPLDTIAGLADEDLGTLVAGVEKELHILFTFDTAATNGCQGDSLTMTLTLTGTQEP